MPLWVLACIIMTGIIILIIWATCRIGGEADRQMDRMLEHRMTFADSDVSDTIETLLGRPGVISMSAKQGQDLTVKVNPCKTWSGEQYTSVGPATIIVIPEDE